MVIETISYTNYVLDSSKLLSNIDPAVVLARVEPLEALLPDEDSPLNFSTGWGCAVQSAVDLVHMLARRGRAVDAACDTINLAYQAATRHVVQQAIRARGHAVDEAELIEIESAIPECRSEIQFQSNTIVGSGSV
ncbi:MAG TPA: hypothetical protein VG122_13830 [Gemmata sp.]|jgi:hypothetical protein|nr:hypothetical protein [Gemmata sp.]